MNDAEMVLTAKQSKRIAKLKKDLEDLASMQAFAHPATIKEYVRRALFDSKMFTNSEIYALTDAMLSK